MRQKFIYTEDVLSEDIKLLFVVQRGQHKQSVLIEECENEEQPFEENNTLPL